ncbi:patatin-like phospholipase family protein [Methylobacterium organophilum]|uniref:patatin-like phospholipase family protein n=1 Tax=Methylobacterium organophilum TaxID=410 RepID=UPI001F135D26|nr:patatin-like phospholipase family protein [Methylobacterium organophilum]UMY18371.1 patatin-like phospholipase family protein [Methylobacterium organophilum]
MRREALAPRLPAFPNGIVEPVSAPPRAPRIGLALGGGSARGWSHIGVIEVLEEAGLYPAVVAGCSIGAVVGGAYAAGRIGALKDFALSLTRRRVIGMIDPRLSGSGLIAGERLRRRLSRELEGLRIEDLRIAFASVATELGSGHEVWLTHGPLADAVRASYAIPGIFPPVPLDGRLLMDGTLVNPVPVRLARDLGADLVICVNLNCDTRLRGSVIRPEPASPAGDESLEAEIETVVRVRSRWELLRGAGLRLIGRGRTERDEGGVPAPGVARVMLQAFNITQDRISRARLAGDPPDVSIRPKLAEFGQFEFHRAALCIELGRQAAKAALPEIRHALEGAAARS